MAHVKIKPPKFNPLQQILLWVLAFVLLLMFYQRMQTTGEDRELSYSNFKNKVQAGEVLNVLVRNDLIKGELKEGARTVHFHTIPLNDAKLVEDLQAAKIDYRGEPDRSWVTSLLLNVGWIVVFVFLWWFLFMRQAQMGGKQAMSFGRSRAKEQDLTKQKVTFADVAGCEEAKEELGDVIDFLKNPKKFQKLGGNLPKGVLLYGPPGTGKTLLARAVAGEAGVPFFTSSGSEFVEMFVGVGASRVRDLFEQAKRNPPAIVFIDELDAVGRHRFAGIGGGHDEREQTLNQLLVELDGFESKEGIILIGSTNRPDVLDPALLRPGRFDRHVNVPIPDIKGRLELLKVHAKKVKMDVSADLSVLSRQTPGFVGADLANAINEAALLAARKDKKSVEMVDLEEAVERVMGGPERKSRIISEEEKKITAYHESGHALVARLLPGTDPVHKVSIIPRGPALGYTMQLPTEDRYTTTKTQILNKLSILLGGQAAEALVFKEITTGSHNDLSKVTAYAQAMVTELGMSERLGPVSLKKEEGEIFLGRDIVRQPHYSDQTAREIDEEVFAIIKKAYGKASDLLVSRRAALDALAAKLLEKETVDADEIEAILNPKPAPAAQTPAAPAIASGEAAIEPSAA
ncbi:MAG: ATP-dependent zinc metalloprotease FtsH [Elusimicrobiales bacterium]|nr:ATP-dependent zinc metalloprotease FtsH [Elusimicrobiales bacterium]